MTPVGSAGFQLVILRPFCHEGCAAYSLVIDGGGVTTFKGRIVSTYGRARFTQARMISETGNPDWAASESRRSWVSLSIRTCVTKALFGMGPRFRRQYSTDRPECQEKCDTRVCITNRMYHKLCITLLYHTFVSHFCITLLYHTFVSHFCITLLCHKVDVSQTLYHTLDGVLFVSQTCITSHAVT
jgi:hypothetical protein